QLVELFDKVLRRDFRHLDIDRARVVLIEALDHLLPPFSPQSRRHARTILEQRGVQVRTGTSVERITATRVHLQGGEVMEAHTLIWAAGVKANPLVRALELDAGPSGRILVEPDLGLAGHLGSFAIGDIAAAVDPDGEPLPLLAPVAMQAGRHVAAQICRSLCGEPTRPFRYTDKGTMATIGRRAAVAELPLGIKLQGTPAWFAWLGLHLVFLVGNRNRFSVLLNWAWNYLTWDRGPRLILELVGAGPGGRRPASSVDDELPVG
ncbi:MAG: FAD-dependent oxidoreductase, partial [Acidimicrobiales bacterium]